jgi:hypothetical protein
MKMTKNIIILFIGLVLMACSKNNEKKFEIKINKTSTGYYYDIYKKSKMIIHQPNIPAVTGSQRFKDSIQCLKIAKLVTKKLEYKNFPTITLEELKSNNIQFRD